MATVQQEEGALRVERRIPAHVVAASLYAMAAWYVSGRYRLYHPHAVGQLAPARASMASVAWAGLCFLLAMTAWPRCSRFQRWGALVPLAIGVMALMACWRRYVEQVAAGGVGWPLP